MADLANLRIAVDSRQVKGAAGDLNTLSRSSQEAERSTSGLANSAKLLGGALAAAGIMSLITSVAKASAEFQSLNASLKVATGSSVAATAAFDEIRKFAAETPYALNQSVEAFLKLKNLGLDPSMASLRSYGNTAASMGKSLTQMIEAVADASTLEFERLKEFGIRAKQEKDNVTFTFQGVSTTVKKSSEEIQQYLINIGDTQFAGAMAEQMNTLNGRFSNLQDNVNNFYVTLGNAGVANILGNALGAVNSAVVYLTNNLATVMGALRAVALAVAGAASAFIAFKLALGVQAVAAYIGQLIALQFALGATSTASAVAGLAIKGFQAALASTGIGVVVVAIGALVGAMYSLATAQSRAREETNGLISSLKTLAQAKSVGFEQARTNVEIEKRLLERDIRLIKERNKAQAVGQGKTIEYVTPDLAAKRERLDAINIGIREADTLKAQANAMAAIPVPAAAAAAGIDKTGRAARAAEDPLKKYRDALADMVEDGKKIGMTPEQVKAFDVEKLALAAATAGYKRYNDIRKQGMANALNEYAVQSAEKLAEKLKEETKARDDANKTHTGTISALKGELSLLGLVGVAREKAALELEREAYIAKFGATAWDEYHKARTGNINAKSVFDKDIEALQTLANNLETAAGMIGGKGGRALQGVLKMEVQLADGSAQKISDAIAKEFPKLGGVLASVISGMQIGNLVGGMAGSKTGGTIGGGLGNVLGKKLLTGALTKIAPELGKFAGPLGALAGGILGGVIGGLLTKTKTGSVTLTQIAGGAMQRTMTGNSAQLKGIADNMANGLLKGLGSMAEQLGGTLGGNVKVSLGMRKKDFVVDPTGMGRTKGSGVMNFGTDEAAAVAYVTQLAIQQGIVTGISAGAQTLIRAGKDLNEQVQKALKFDQVFKDLLSETDPLQASLNELSAEMEKLKVIFGEAGASAAEYAKLEELYAIKQAKAIFEANRPRRELEIQLMEAQGNASGALAAQRALELEAMDASLRGLQAQIYAAEDAAKASEVLAEAQALAAEAQALAAEEAAALAEAALQLARERRGLEIDLMEAQGNVIGALTARRALELQGMDASLRGLQKQIYAAQDKAKADEVAAQAAQKYKDALANVTQTILDEVNRLRGINTGSSSVLLKAQFATLTAQARNGNLDALGKLPELSKSIEEATMSSATSALEVARIRAFLAASLSETLAQQGVSVAPVNATSAALTFDGNSTASANTQQTTGELSNMSAMLHNALYQVAKNTGKSYELLDRWDGDGMPDIRGAAK